jgi:amidophosphoribosyltransferase
MSDPIKHECGIALLRLKKPLQFYLDKYGTAFYGLNKMYLLMEKQHNRGQDGVGLANIKLDMQPGTRYISRKRSVSNKPIQDVFSNVMNRFKQLQDEEPEKLKDAQFLKDNYAFTGELFLGHLRYGTYGKNSIENCHPFLRQNNWQTRNLVVAGNFNLTNVDSLFDILVRIGQHPKEKSDTVTVLEKIGHFLDVENERLFQKYKTLGYSNEEISGLIAENIDVQDILKNSAEDWDGGYAMAGLLGHGDAFVLRDPNGIRPAHYYEDDEVVVVTSERPVIQTAFNVPFESIKELDPGHAISIKKNAEVSIVKVREPQEKLSCSFERIYFSRGNDVEIYKERKRLGHNVCAQVVSALDGDIDNAVFSFIPNTAETAFYGLIKGIEDELNERKIQALSNLGNGIKPDEIREILSQKTRIEKIAIKDAKLRTFITQDDDRDEMVAHVYDITHGAVRKGKDSLVVVDDSIVRGTTLKKSIIRMLDRLKPKQIIVVSSAPQIRYPDCYGIDMAKMGDFIAFQAVVSLLKKTAKENLLNEVYEKCKREIEENSASLNNPINELYSAFSADEISDEIAKLITPDDIDTPVKVIYQTIEGLHEACPKNKGDWYFTGNYPTPGGARVVLKSFINYMEGKNVRAY